MYILGVNAYHPNSSACLLQDGDLVAAAEEERFVRIKHWSGLPVQSVKYCLEAARISMDDIDHIAVNRDPKARFLKKVLYVISKKPSFSLITDRFSNMVNVKSIKSRLMSVFLPSDGGKKNTVHYIEHHRAHLASSYFVSPFDKAAVVSIDGFGDFASCVVAKGSRNRISIMHEINYPHSLGIFYTACTQYLGFEQFGDEYKVMGLAAYGKPAHTREMEHVVYLGKNGTFSLNMDYFSLNRNGAHMSWKDAAPVLGSLFSQKMVDMFGPARTYGSKITERHFDIAASVQAVYENVFFHILRNAYSVTGSLNICLSGGCALNSVANGKIFKNTKFREIYIQPASSDAGGSIGAAYYLYNQIMKHERKFVMKHAYWGPEYDDAAIQAEIESKKDALQMAGCVMKSCGADELCRSTAKLISEGRITGWFQGRMEWGPRALGNRSIVCDPRKKEMKDILNSRIKKREWFRPFAPSILLERAGEYFDIDYPDPFMLKVYPIKEDKRSIIPAVVHCDGTGRVQTVSKDENPLYWQLIREFERLTGIPVVLNTSFNENEPIVCSPAEALECFLRTKMDVLVLGSHIITKR